MVREDILGGLISALVRGETLRHAMISLHNAGYEKKEIEWAARTIQMQGYEQMVSESNTKNIIPHQQKTQKLIPGKPTPVVSTYGSESQSSQISSPEIVKKDKIVHGVRIEQQNKQELKKKGGIMQDYELGGTAPREGATEYPQLASRYEPKQKPVGKMIITTLIILLICLLGILILVFFFKQEIIAFFNNLFS